MSKYWLYKTRFIWITILAIVIGTAIAHAEVPYKDVAMAIYKVPYLSDATNCQWKAEGYAHYLAEKGFRVFLMYGTHEKAIRSHCWVAYVDDKGHLCYVDLTDEPKAWGWKADQYKGYTVTSIKKIYKMFEEIK